MHVSRVGHKRLRSRTQERLVQLMKQCLRQSYLSIFNHRYWHTLLKREERRRQRAEEIKEFPNRKACHCSTPEQLWLSPLVPCLDGIMTSEDIFKDHCEGETLEEDHQARWWENNDEKSQESKATIIWGQTFRQHQAWNTLTCRKD